MGVELFGIVFLLGLGVLGFFFVTGAFGAKAAEPGSDETAKPKHVYLENDSNERIVGGVETADRVRAEAESDPDTEVRT